MNPYVIEPKEFKPIEFGFGATDLKSFDTPQGIILWSCIKSCHITDQHFDDNVKNAAMKFGAGISKDYMEFRYSIPYYLDSYGSVDGRLDDSFWLMIHQLLLDISLFKFTVPGDDTVHTLSHDTLKMFKPEKYI